MATPASAPAPSRPISIAKPNQATRANGILPAPSAADRARTGSGAPSKSSSPRLKIVVRRLPPGLTEEEFYSLLGEEWKIGNRRVDWASYRPGKVSKDPNKPSKPARAYLQLTSEQHLSQLSERVRTTFSAETKGPSNDSVFLGPPSVEFAPYGRLPSSKPRRDGRQGTIDQDQEFIDFLESLTNPIPKITSVDVAAEKDSKTDDAKPVTPLIQYLKDKKANKGKESSTPGKSSKHGRQESKESKTPQVEKKATSKGGKDSSSGAPEKKTAPPTKIEKPSRETAKPASKQPASLAKSSDPSPAPKIAPEQGTAQAPTPSAPKQERRRERGSASVAAKILQRDLGIGQSPQSRRKKENISSSSGGSSLPAQQSSNATAEGTATGAAPHTASTTPVVSTSSVSASTSTTPAQAPTGPAQPPTGPAGARSQTKTSPPQKQNPQAKQSTLAPAKPAPPPPIVTPGATQAFLKHANPSQGVTELLLEEAFAPFGTVDKVEIDKKKGFAYIDFADTETLQKAVNASPVKVAQGQVVVLERKTGASLQNRNARGGAAVGVRGGGGPQGGRGARGIAGRGRGGRGHAQSSKAAAASSTGPVQTVQTNIPATQESSASNTASANAAPSPATAT